MPWMSKWENSPASAPTISSSAPPPSISMPVVSNPDSGSSASRDQKEPIAHDQSDHDSTARTPTRRPDPFDDHKPEWKNRHEERGEARRDELFRPHHRSISTQEKKAASDDCVAPVYAHRSGSSARSRPQVQHPTRNQESNSAHEEWRNRLDAIADREIRRSPDHVDRGKRSDYLRAGSVAAFMVQCSRFSRAA